MIPETKIQEIKDHAAADIVDIIGSYIKLKRSGSSYKSKCPFHDENTASFSVSPEKGIYKCFGCGEGGDAIGFLMKHEGMEFIEVIKHLARRYMIDIPGGNNSKRRFHGKSNMQIYEAVLPGITDMKRNIKKQNKVYLVFDRTFALGSDEETAWLPVTLPVSRGQFKITGLYAEEIILMGGEYDRNALFESVSNAVKMGIDDLFIWVDTGRKKDWMSYIVERHPEETDRIKRIITSIPDEITYRLYSQQFSKLLN